MTRYLNPRSVTIPLYQGDSLDTLAQLRRAVDAAEQRLDEAADGGPAGNARVGDDEVPNATLQNSLQEAWDAFNAGVDDAAETALAVEIRTIGSKRFAKMLIEHPPRKVDAPRRADAAEDAPVATVDHPEDRPFGVNVTTFPDAILTYRSGPIVTIAAPDFASSDEVQEFIDDEVSAGDKDKLWIAALQLNRAVSTDPKSLKR